jgi:alpha-N-arabinofuranosidase
MFLKMYSVLTIKKGFLLILFFTFLSCGSDDEPTFKPEPIPSVDAKVTIYGTKKSHTISPMIQGHGLSYSVEKDIIYNDGTMAQLYKDVGAGFLRWPGGTPTTMYHWNDLAAGWVDNWNPNYPKSWDPAPEDYMDLNEYMTLSKAAGTEPMLGINMSSGMEWDREADGINEAVALVKYCQANNFDVKCFYLDNEPYHEGNGYNKDLAGNGGEWTPTIYAEKFNLYADSIRKYIPDAKLFVNWKEHLRDNRSDYTTLINIAGDNIDYIDVHWYWKWGDSNWNAWKAKTPMENETQWYDGGSYVEETAYFNNLTTSLGHPNIKLASLEWNIAPGDHNTNPVHTPYKTALMQSEMQMQMMQAGIEYASMWTTQWMDSSTAEFQQLVNSDDDYKPSPTAAFFKLYKNALNGVLLESTTIVDNLLVTSVLKDGKKLFVYLLNKNNNPIALDFEIDGYSILSVPQALCFQDPGITQNISVQQEDTNYVIEVPKYSLTMIEFLVE